MKRRGRVSAPANGLAGTEDRSSERYDEEVFDSIEKVAR